MLTLAAALLLLTGFAHSYLGERYLLMRLFRRDNLPELLGSVAFTKGTLRFVWHLLSIVWLGVAWLLLQADGQPLSSRTFLQTVAVTAFISALFPLLFTRGKHLSWIVFLAVAALLWRAAASTGF